MYDDPERRVGEKLGIAVAFVSPWVLAAAPYVLEKVVENPGKVFVAIAASVRAIVAGANIIEG